MDPNAAFLHDQVPPALRAKIPSTLKVAYDAAKAIIEHEPVFNIPTAEDNWGRIIQWCVDFGFHKLVQTGGWPYEARWQYFARPTGRYLEIIASHSVITISQSDDPSKQPRDVVFRTNKRLNNQLHLKGILKDEEGPATGLPHILLLHGHQELNFAHLAIPNERHAAGFLYRTTNLMLMPHEVSLQEPPMEETDIEAVMTLKEDIDRWRRDNGSE